jgi:hypothetical protein
MTPIIICVHQVTTVFAICSPGSCRKKAMLKSSAIVFKLAELIADDRTRIPNSTFRPQNPPLSFYPMPELSRTYPMIITSNRGYCISWVMIDDYSSNTSIFILTRRADRFFIRKAAKSHTRLRRSLFNIINPKCMCPQPSKRF